LVRLIGIKLTIGTDRIDSGKLIKDEQECSIKQRQLLKHNLVNAPKTTPSSVMSSVEATWSINGHKSCFGNSACKPLFDNFSYPDYIGVGLFELWVYRKYICRSKHPSHKKAK